MNTRSPKLTGVLQQQGDPRGRASRLQRTGALAAGFPAAAGLVVPQRTSTEAADAAAIAIFRWGGSRMRKFPELANFKCMRCKREKVNVYLNHEQSRNISRNR